MDLNQIHLVISISTLLAIIGMLWRAGGWYNAVNMRLTSLRKSHIYIRRKQDSMTEQLNKKHESNVAELGLVKLNQTILAKDVEALEGRMDLIVGTQDDILVELKKKVKYNDGN